MYKWAPTSNRHSTTNRIPRNSLKTNNEKILTGARTHIRIFSFRSFTTQNPAQLIQHPRYWTNAKRSNDRAASSISSRNWPTNRSSRKQTIKAHLTETRITHPGSRIRTSTRFWSKSRSYRKQTSKPLLPGARTAFSRVRRDAVISPSHKARGPAGISSAVVGGVSDAIQWTFKP
jgi:hypothetical protein